MTRPKTAPFATAALAIMLFLAACSDSPVMVEPDKIAGFEPGKTNQTEVVAALGKPLEIISQADGTKIDQYPYAHGQSGSGIVPGFLGGSEHPSTYGMISFTYGPSGVLKAIDGAK